MSLGVNDWYLSRVLCRKARPRPLSLESVVSVLPFYACSATDVVFKRGLFLTSLYSGVVILRFR